MRPVPQGFFKYAQDVQSYGCFDTEDRHHAQCMECGKDFHTDTVLKYKRRHICPHCGRELTMYTVRTRPMFSAEYGVHYIDRDVNNEAVVRHFLVTKHLRRSFREERCKLIHLRFDTILRHLKAPPNHQHHHGQNRKTSQMRSCVPCH